MKTMKKIYEGTLPVATGKFTKISYLDFLDIDSDTDYPVFTIKPEYDHTGEDVGIEILCDGLKLIYTDANRSIGEEEISEDEFKSLTGFDDGDIALLTDEACEYCDNLEAEKANERSRRSPSYMDSKEFERGFEWSKTHLDNGKSI